ncbi:MAG TPA: TolC family protein [Saprospiraceae bacterium]|nr:TolC family protein [Saprospiraceae bacterium]HQW25899.1 TolC family protein [Saprospiraceae bacterium]
MYRRITLLLTSFLSFLVLYGQRSMSLSDCMDYALANHAEIRIAEYNMKDADWQIKENRAVAFPQIGLGLHANRFIQQPALPAEALGFGEPGQKITFALKNDIGGTISFNQLLFDNKYIATIKAAKMYKDYAAIQFQGVVEKLRNRVTDAYIPALVVAEGVRILDKNIESQKKLVFETKANYQAGFVEQLDVDRLEYALTTFETDRESLIRQRDKLIDVLKFTINMPNAEEITLLDDVDRLLAIYGDINIEEKLDYMNRPDYVASLKATELNDIQTDAFRKDWWPVLSFFGSYDPTFQGNDELFWIPSAIVGVQLNMPIYDGGYYKAKEERSVIQSLKVVEQRKMLTMSYDLQIETARKDYYSTKQKMEDREQSLNLAERIFETSETKFRQGVGSSFEVTQAQAGLYRSQADLVNARFDYLKSLVAFKQALGKN